MEIPRLSESVCKVTVFQKDALGNLKPVVIYQGKRNKKKGTPGLGRLEKLVRDLAEVQRSYIDSFLAQHEESKADQPDGWLRDLPLNSLRAARKAVRRFG